MRLIMGKDYYDGAGQVDPTLTFVRNGDFNVLKDVDLVKTYFNQLSGSTSRVLGKLFYRKVVDIEGTTDKNLEYRDSVQVYYELIYVAGFWFKSIVFDENSPDSLFRNKPVTRYFDVESIFELEKYSTKYDNYRSIFTNETWKDEVTNIFARKFNSDLMIDSKIVVAQFKTDFDLRENYIAANNYALKDHQLYKVLSPTECHMAISGYIGGVLTTRENMIELSDLSKLKKAGFDKKTSFRKPPSKRGESYA